MATTTTTGAATPLVQAQEAHTQALRALLATVRDETRKAAVRDAVPAGLPTAADLTGAYEGLRPIAALLSEAVKAGGADKALLNAVVRAQSLLEVTARALATTAKTAAPPEPTKPANPFLAASAPVSEEVAANRKIAEANAAKVLRSHEDQTAQVEPVTPPHVSDAQVQEREAWFKALLDGDGTPEKPGFKVPQRKRFLVAYRDAVASGQEVPDWADFQGESADWPQARRERVLASIDKRFS